MRLKLSFSIFDLLQELRDPLDQIVSTQTAEDSKDEEKTTHLDKWEHRHRLAMSQPFSASPLCFLCVIYITWSMNLTQTNLAVSVFFILFHQQSMSFPLKAPCLPLIFRSFIHSLSSFSATLRVPQIRSLHARDLFEGSGYWSVSGTL